MESYLPFTTAKSMDFFLSIKRITKMQILFDLKLIDEAQQEVSVQPPSKIQPYLRLVYIWIVFPRKAFEKNEFHFILILISGDEIMFSKIKI